MLCSTFINTFVPDFIANELHLISNKRKSWDEELIFQVSPCFHEHVTSFAIFLKQEIVTEMLCQVLSEIALPPQEVS